MSKLIISICDFLTFPTQVLHNVLDYIQHNVLHQILHKIFLRKPPLYAKNGSNHGFWIVRSISKHGQGWSVIFSQMVDTHSKSDFSSSSRVSHTHDVIDMYINIGVQKTFARHHFQLAHGISILIKNLVPLGQNTELQCIYIHRSL